MANPLGEGGGDNPRVTSKFDRMHGHPRKPGRVSHAGGTAAPGAHGMATHDGDHGPEAAFGHERLAPSKVTEHAHGTQHSYSHEHPAMAGMHAGKKAKHPFHDGEQAKYEDEKGYG